ncbi:MAG: hypothetical protein KF901_22485 [Myxococcales bacterium]|nr:hypothetical protein [Myxococcales bacterium]
METGDRPRERGARSRFAHAHWKRGREEKDQSVDHLRQARSLDDVAVRPGGRVAFVCIDGAKIGQLLVETKRAAEYAALSHRLHQAFSSVRDPDVSRVLGLETKKHQVVLAGGDDLLLVAPAEARGDYPDALELTRRIVRHIEEAFDDRVGVGAGVLITSGGIPARMAFDYARSLCNSAKSAISDEQRSAVDFELVLGGSPLSGGVLSRRASDERSARFIRTQRPYGIHDFERLLRVAAELRKRRVGRAAITNLVRAVSQPEAVARIDAFYQLARDTNLRAALGVEALDVAGATEWLFAEQDGGRPASRTVYTAVPDIALVHKLQGAR